MNRIRTFDPWVVTLSLALTFVGLFFAFDAGYARSIHGGRGTIPREFISQLIPLLPSLFVAYFIATRPAAWLRRKAKLIWVGAFVSLFLPMMPVIGVSLNGAARWFKIPGIPFNFQPAEFLKVAIILYLGAVLANRKEFVPDRRAQRSFIDALDYGTWPRIKRLWPGLMALAAILLVEMEPDMGTAAVIAMIGLFVCIVGNVSGRTLGWTAALCGCAVAILMVKEPYRMDRFTNHTSRWTDKNVDATGYQTVQSELAMATGGVAGVGIGIGRAKHIMPAATTDFVMATIGEEFGALGSLGVIGLLAALTFRLLYLARRARDEFAMLVFYGMASWIGIQGTVNVMMANGLLPAIGIPLPFISTGGSSLLALWMGIGLTQSVLQPARQEEVAVATGRNRWGNGRTRLSRA